MSEATAQMALCRLLLRGDRWVPFGLNTKLTANHRCGPNGPVIQAVFIAATKADRIVGWKKHAAFDIHEVQADGSLVPSLDASFMAEVLAAHHPDQAAQTSGVIGISRQLTARRLEREHERIPMHLRQAAVVQAAKVIVERLRGRRVRGVSVFQPEAAPEDRGSPAV